MRFNPGDKVLCINSEYNLSGTVCVEKGAVYTVRERILESILLKEILGGYSIDNFRVISGKPNPPIKDKVIREFDYSLMKSLWDVNESCLMSNGGEFPDKLLCPLCPLYITGVSEDSECMLDFLGSRKELSKALFYKALKTKNDYLIMGVLDLMGAPNYHFSGMFNLINFEYLLTITHIKTGKRVTLPVPSGIDRPVYNLYSLVVETAEKLIEEVDNLVRQDECVEGNKSL